MSTADGVIIAAKYTSANGNYVKVRHNSTYTTILHMRRSSQALKTACVKQGDVIGYVGSTGLATGPHVLPLLGQWKTSRSLQAKLPDAKPLESDRMDTKATWLLSNKSSMRCKLRENSDVESKSRPAGAFFSG